MITRTGLMRRRQRGVVLLISLMFLIVMTLIAITAMSGAGLEEKMAGNMRDRTIAFQSAEAALRDAELNIIGATSLPAFGTGGLYKLNSNTGRQLFEANNWSVANWQDSTKTVPYTDTSPLPGVAAAPRFYIERLPPVPLSSIPGNSLNKGTEYGEKSKITYRITARGVGQTDTAVTILQSTYVRD